MAEKVSADSTMFVGPSPDKQARILVLNEVQGFAEIALDLRQKLKKWRWLNCVSYAIWFCDRILDYAADQGLIQP